ncbi:hypothetical protein BgiBS90_019033, partial [Biomphalaria glabrata]
LKTCRNYLNDNFMVQDGDKSVEVTFCFTDFQNEINNSEVVIKHNKTEFRVHNEKVTFHWKSKSGGIHSLHIFIFNITESDLTEWVLTLCDIRNQRRMFEKNFYLYTAKVPVQFYISRESDLNEDNTILVCSGSNFPKKIQIISRCDGVILHEILFNPKNYKRTLELRHYWNTLKPLEAYECRIFDFQNETSSELLDIKMENEPAFICPIKDKQIKANVYNTVSLRFKVLAYPEIILVIVTKSANHIEDTNWIVEIRKLSKGLWSVKLIKDILQVKDFGNYTVSVTSNVKTPVNETFILSLKDHPHEKMIVQSSWNNSANETITVFYILVKSGLPLSLPTNEVTPYTIEMITNKMASEYLIKVSIQNHTEYIGKPETFTLLDGSTEMVFTFKATDKFGILLPCSSTNQEVTLWTSIGESLQFTMCIISDSLIHNENVGFDKTSMANTSSFKYSIEIVKENNKHYITWTIKNITKDDIKFYVLRIRDNLKRTATLILNLHLKE